MLANVVRPTLGPVPRLVAVEPVAPGDKRPEMLDNAAVIARRFLALPNRDADMGAMFFRHVLWRQHERVGDGAATTAVLFQSIYNQSLAYIAAGGNPERLRRALERGLVAVLAELERNAKPVEGPKRITQLAESICHDAALAAMIGEIFDTVGAYGQVELRSGRRPETQREYVLGTYYKGKLLSEWMESEQIERRRQLEDAAVLVTDFSIHDPADLSPLLRVAIEAEIPALMVVAKELSKPATARLLAAGKHTHPCQIIAVRAPDALTGQAAMLEDLAMLTGARLFIKAAGDSLRTLKPEHLGRARRVWGDHEYFGLVGGQGSPRTVRAYVESLQMAIENATDLEIRKKLRERVGKLLGATAVLWVGGISEGDIATRKELAARTVEAVRSALGHGVLPGAGVALLACRERLRTLAEETDDLDEHTAYAVLSRALEEPARAILTNAGYDAAPWLHEIDRAPAGHGFDARTASIIDVVDAGIIDSAGVLRAAVHEAIASAALALTVDVLVHKKLPEMSFEP